MFAVDSVARVLTSMLRSVQIANDRTYYRSVFVMSSSAFEMLELSMILGRLLVLS